MKRLKNQCGDESLIGVVCKENQRAVAGEFFELFKTPWEFWNSGKRYDAVIATSDEIPQVHTRLLLVYGSLPKNTDAQHGVTIQSQRRGAAIRYKEVEIPIYGEIASFEPIANCQRWESPSVGTLGLRMADETGVSVIRVGYDLLQEVQTLLVEGQPKEFAHVATLDVHVQVLRNLILNEGIPLMEVAPGPHGFPFSVCLTHDIDFVGIRNHKFDHTMLGFLLRSTLDAAAKYLKKKITLGRLLKSWRAAASLPFVYLGMAKDFWEPFDWYLGVEKGLAPTYFLIPFKGRSGERVSSKYASRRAAPYEVAELSGQIEILRKNGCEVGVHGIDAWHSVEKGQIESAKIAKVSGHVPSGIRMHWLLQDSDTPTVLDKAGYSYDSTAGYNETVGYRNGTSQVFRPLGAETLLEIPLHIQDGALFYPQNLDLTDSEADARCQPLLANAKKFGGVLTVLWHDRSHAPERFWGDFYVDLIETLKSCQAWFCTCSQVVAWFSNRRQVRFETKETDSGMMIVVSYSGAALLHPFQLRVYKPVETRMTDVFAGEVEVSHSNMAWNGNMNVQFDSDLRLALGRWPDSDKY